MKFGRLDEINAIDYTLPSDHPITGQVLSGQPTPKSKLRVYAGLPEWGKEEFAGIIYPKGTKTKDFFRTYITQFNSVELNATGYRIPAKKSVENWRDQAPDGFKFCPKISREISHVKPLGKNKASFDTFVDSVSAFEDHLGTVFLQLAETFSAKRVDDLIDFLGLWDTSLPLHVEIRHEDWFENKEVLDRLFEAMRARNIGTVITDTSGRRDAVHQCLTTKTAFIRFDGNELHPTDFTRIDAWVVKLKEWIDQGLETVYFFFHTPSKELTVYHSNYFIEKMNKLCGTDLKPATIYEPRRDEMLNLE